MHQFRLVMNIELAHEIEFVRFHGLQAEAQHAGYLADSVPFGQQFHDFRLARRQWGPECRGLFCSNFPFFKSPPNPSGLTNFPPRCTSRSTLASLSAGVSLSRYPAAPACSPCITYS